MDSGPITLSDIGFWPNFVAVLLKFTAFLSAFGGRKERMNWASMEMNISFEWWVGHRLLPEKTVPTINQACRTLMRVLRLGTAASLWKAFSVIWQS